MRLPAWICAYDLQAIIVANTTMATSRYSKTGKSLFGTSLDLPNRNRRGVFMASA
jgi:hypothetical protein